MKRAALSHLGGTLPWVAWRLSMLDDFPFAPAGFIDRNTQVLSAGIDDRNLVAITRDDAERLFADR